MPFSNHFLTYLHLHFIVVGRPRFWDVKTSFSEQSVTTVLVPLVQPCLVAFGIDLIIERGPLEGAAIQKSYNQYVFHRSIFLLVSEERRVRTSTIQALRLQEITDTITLIWTFPHCLLGPLPLYTALAFAGLSGGIAKYIKQLYSLSCVQVLLQPFNVHPPAVCVLLHYEVVRTLHNEVVELLGLIPAAVLHGDELAPSEELKVTSAGSYYFADVGPLIRPYCPCNRILYLPLGKLQFDELPAEFCGKSLGHLVGVCIQNSGHLHTRLPWSGWFISVAVDAYPAAICVLPDERQVLPVLLQLLRQLPARSPCNCPY